MDLAAELKHLKPRAAPSPWADHEWVRGYGVMAVPFDTGHVLALRNFPENDFAPFISVWHRAPDDGWSIYVDGPRMDTACPRYYGTAARHNSLASIKLTWTGPNDLLIEMDAPALTWNVSMTSTPLVRVMNAVSPRLPDAMWRNRLVLGAMGWMARALLGMGSVDLSGTAPGGQRALLMPRRIFPIASSRAVLDGVDLGRAARANENPEIGGMRLPARPTFAVGGAYFTIEDQAEHERMVRALRLEA